MNNSPNKRAAVSFAHAVTGFMLIIYFDLKFNYIGSRVDTIQIDPDAPDNWGSETIQLIPYVMYEYALVTNENPEISRSGKARLDKAQRKVKFFASLPKAKTAVLRVVKEPAVRNLPPNKKSDQQLESYYLEESYSSLDADSTVSERKKGKSSFKKRRKK